MDNPKNNPSESNSIQQFSYFKDPLTLTGAFSNTTMIDVRYSLKCPPPKPVILSKTQKPTQPPLYARHKRAFVNG
jgi:hypothetical protein